MRAAWYEQFQSPVTIKTLPDPEPSADGVVIRVEASGICRSDWHGWQGNDPEITLPHVPGHEMAGVIAETGANVKKWEKDDRITLPFVCGCGTCDQCISGNHQVCDHQFQPGFTHWGSFAEYVAIEYADVNLVRLPQDMDFVIAATLGCRFATSYRAVVYQGKVSEGQWIAVHGCGGVGLSAIMIAKALGAQTIAIDISDSALMMARKLGTDVTLNPEGSKSIPEDVMEATNGGADVSIDALGSIETSKTSILCLKKRGRHVQVGLMTGKNTNPELPMDVVIARELEITGSHGMQAHIYPEMLQMISDRQLDPGILIRETVNLDRGIEILQSMDRNRDGGIAVINKF